MLGIVVATGCAGLATYHRASQEANRLFDYQIQQAALSLPAHFTDEALYQNEEFEEDIVIQVWNPDEKLIYTSNPDLSLPHFKRQGFQTVNAFDVNWRIYNETRRQNFVQIAQPTSVRDYLAANFALRSLLPFMVFIPVMLLLAHLIVRKQLRPLQQIANAVQARNHIDLQPLSGHSHWPSELQPIVLALNDLLGRLDKALSAQRAFIADAAHELRSPLTALKLQLQLAERVHTEEQRTKAIAKLHERLNRTIHLVEQMLTLARQDAAQTNLPLSAVNLNTVVQQVVADYQPLADNRQIQLQVKLTSEPALVNADAASLTILLKNLIDNALAYTSPQGQIEVSVVQLKPYVRLQVVDNGPGIPLAERERVFDRFYRCETNSVTGTGLGLAIVKQIAAQHQAQLALGDNPHGKGLQVSVLFHQAS